MKKNLLTVNIITYNHSEYIKDCIESILSQKTNFEFIVRIFDDCSTDGTQDICRKYKEKYPDKIELHLSDTNLGESNGVLVNALRSYNNIETPYYIFIEGDDFRINENGFQRQIDVLEQNPNCVFSAGKFYTHFNNKLDPPGPCLKEGIYSKADFINNPQYIMFTHLSARIVRTKYISIDPEYPTRYLNDIKQMYTLIEKGDFYLCEQAYSAYRITNRGISTGRPVFERTAEYLNILIDINLYTDNKFNLNLFNYFVSTVNWYLYQENIKFSNPIKTNNMIPNKLKAIKHYLLPPLLIDLFNIPRDIIRKIRKYMGNK